MRREKCYKLMLCGVEYLVDLADRARLVRRLVQAVRAGPEDIVGRVG
jgi:hypothetical protein